MENRLEVQRLCRGKLAEQAQLQTKRSYNRAHIILLVVDALTIEQGDYALLRRELTLVKDIVSEGRAIVVLLNKVDLLAEGKQLEVTILENIGIPRYH